MQEAGVEAETDKEEREDATNAAKGDTNRETVQSTQEVQAQEVHMGSIQVTHAHLFQTHEATRDLIVNILKIIIIDTHQEGTIMIMAGVTEGEHKGTTAGHTHTTVGPV